MRGKFVAYYRVSTTRQGQSGLGLEAQRHAVMEYLNGGTWQLLEEFTEVETGKGANALDRRPVLAEAIAFAKKHRAKLVIAKLDRLARNVSFVSSLMESKVTFVCADMPDANELTIHLLAAVGEYERKLISERTKAALAAAKARGKKLGNPNLNLVNEKARTGAAEFAAKMRPTFEHLAERGLTRQGMAEELTRLGIPTAGNRPTWSATQVQRVAARLGL